MHIIIVYVCIGACSGVAVKNVLSRWQEGVRCWDAQPHMLAHRTFLDLYLMPKAMSLMVVKLKVNSVHLLIYTGMGNTYLTFAAFQFIFEP